MSGGGHSRRSVLAGMGAATAFSFTAAGCQNRDRDAIGFYNWDSFIGPHTARAFERRTGIAVEQSVFATDDELFAKLSGGSEDYDVVVPSHTGVERLVAARLLRTLDPAALPNLRNLMPFWRDPAYDRGCRHSVPYSWTVTGLGYRQARLQPAGAVPDSWRLAFASTRYAHRIALLPASTPLLALGAKFVGQPLTPATIGTVTEMLIAQKPAVAYLTNDGIDMLAADRVDVAMVDNAALAAAMSHTAGLGFVVPREGGLLRADALAIPRASRRPAAAQAFIDFLLGAGAARDLALLTGFPTPNAAARALMPAAYRDSPALFPAGPGMAASSFGHLVEEADALVFDHATMRLRASPPSDR